MSKRTGSSNREFISQPKTRELPIASVDLSEVLFSCYEQGLTIEEAQRECVARGISLENDGVENGYEELSRAAKWLDEFFIGYRQSKLKTVDVKS